jgi:hypothetical protein
LMPIRDHQYPEPPDVVPCDMACKAVMCESRTGKHSGTGEHCGEVR